MNQKSEVNTITQTFGKNALFKATVILFVKQLLFLFVVVVFSLVLGKGIFISLSDSQKKGFSC